MMTTQMFVETHVTMMKQVLQGFEQEEVAARSSWDTAEKRAVVPTGWRERTYDIKLLYGVPEVQNACVCWCVVFLRAGRMDAVAGVFWFRVVGVGGDVTSCGRGRCRTVPPPP